MTIVCMYIYICTYVDVYILSIRMYVHTYIIMCVRTCYICIYVHIAIRLSAKGRITSFEILKRTQ